MFRRVCRLARTCQVTQRLSVLRSFIGKNSCQFSSDSPGRFHSPIVDLLWNLRREISKDLEKLPAADKEAPLEEKITEDSRTRVEYPFSVDERLAQSYRNPWGQVRMGKILEDLDALAGNVAMQHTRQKGSCRKLVLVTAGVDRIKLSGRACITQDMAMEGVVLWTGKSSIEIGITAYSSGKKWI
eukprot:CAMPEP_0167751404 /NCGR_PEP_ID=MMETSP0110_2-20121227/6551_1 /TAXON_ID=629695 /ORGANISM="Gymnochlora sp., Strain CCMP2014" /LENGTH=184 /DNA_ID=CAMNT_0007636879 /DNA_START=17 /DNA_END=568 /DNA_ORIENTATION=-